MTLVRVGGLRQGEAELFEAIETEGITVWFDTTLELADHVTIKMADYASDLPDRDLIAEGVF